MLFGAYKSSRKKENLNLLAGLFRNFGSLVFDDESAEIYGKIRAALNSKGSPIGPNDLLIAAIAVRHDALLITHNTGEFGRVKGLQWVDWETTDEKPPHSP